MKRFLILIFVFAFLGCATAGTRIQESNLSKIEKGKTTLDEIVALFGQPSTMLFDADGNLQYSYFSSNVKNTAWNFIPVVNVVHSEMKMNNQNLIIIFTQEKIVKDYHFINSDSPIKYGLIP